MTVYELLGRPDRYQSFTTADTEEWHEKPHWFSGRPMAEEWEPPHLEIYGKSRVGRRLVPGDFSTFSTHPVFSKRAVEALDDVLRANGELLPIDTPQGTYYAFNVLTSIDALDEEHSELRRFPEGGIYSFRRYAFHNDRLGDATIFKIPQNLVRTYVTDAFVKRVEEAGLVGFRFDPLWSLPEPEAAG
jgi:hypothetical protein